MKIAKAVFLCFFITGTLLGAETMAQSEPEAVIPFELANEHIIIQLRIEGSDPLNFMFDSGAGGTLVAKHIADSLGLVPSSYRKNVGVAGTHQVGVVKSVNVSLAEVDFNTSFLSAETYLEEMDDGRKVHGIIGYPVLSRYVVEIDYEASEIRLYSRFTYSYKGKGREVPIDIRSNLPIAHASGIMYNGVAFDGDFLVDTGARSDLIISSHVVVEYGMAENVGKYYTVRARIGSSQRKSKIRYGRLQSINFGGYKFDNIPVALSSDNKGLLARPDITGILGNRLLRRFNLIFDYQRGKLYLEPSIFIGNDYVINSSGLNLHFKGGKPYVRDIVDRSPADKAGLHVGDELIAVNGKQVVEMSATEIREVFLKDKGKVELVIKRNNRLKYTAFVLKPLI